MYLKSLELCGFKSFPEKIELTFDPGITAIVGPNGSGKSNISDAIRWVLGEQSAKHLRGSRMEDIIFAGTQSKKPLGFAEVSITIDNSDKKMNIQYNEVTITRRVFRMGESEYYINRTACRLKDINELFMDTGLGRDGYSLMGQGKIDEIINSKPEDRRSFFEEAAGISKYKYRKTEAERKLSQVQDNISRIDDIIAELKLQVDPLKTQSEKAKQYLDLREQLKKYEANLYISVIAKNNAEFALISQNKKIVDDQFDNLNEEITKAEQDIEAYFSNIDSMENKIGEMNEEISCLETRNTTHKNDILLIQNTIKHNNEMIERLNREISEQDLLLNQNESAVAQKDERIEYYKQKCTELSNEINILSEKVAKTEHNLQDKSDKLSSNKNKGAKIQQRMNDIDTNVSNGRVLIEQYNARCHEIQALKAQKQQKNTDYLMELESQTTLTKDIRIQLTEQRQSQDTLEQQNAVQKTQVEKIEQAYQTVKDHLDSAIRRRELLLEMERDFEGFQKAVKTVMADHKKGLFSGIFGPVSTLIQTDLKYTVAIEQALGGAMQNIVVESEEDAKKVIEYLKVNKAGRVTFLPISSVKSRQMDAEQAKKHKGYIGIADSLVTYDSKFENIIKSLLGTTVVMDTIDNAIAFSRKIAYRYRIVTLDGEIVNAGGAISGGFSNRQTGILSRNAQIKELKQTISDFEQKIAKLEKTVADEQAKLKKIESELMIIRDSIITKQQEEIREDAKRHYIQSQQSAVELELSQMDDELMINRAKIETVQKDMECTHLTHCALKKELAQIEQEINALESQVMQMNMQKEQYNTKLIEMRMKLSDVEKDLGFEVERKKSIKDIILNKEEQTKQKKMNIQELSENMDDLADDIRFKESQIDEITKEMEDKKKLLQDKQSEKKELSTQIMEKQKSMKEKQSELLLIQQEKGRIEAKWEKLETENDSIIERLWEDYNLTYAAAQDLKQKINCNLKSEIKTLKIKISQLGSVNVDAIEEYKRVSERYEFLSTQKEDLVVSRDTILKVISEMQHIMKAVFLEKFKEISENFSSVFKTLFNGGNANITLSENDDILESGIEIEVQPPGKKLQNLSLLSGGEKAFTAIALLFAIIKTRPTPFCIFDEIEAALDDVNVYKFAEYIKQFTCDTQFIVVTHRRGTMESADILYGVTMQQKGVSQLLKLKFDDFEKYA